MFADCDVSAAVNDDSAEISVEPEEEISNGYEKHVDCRLSFIASV